MKKVLLILFAILFSAAIVSADSQFGVSLNYEFTDSSQVAALQAGDLAQVLRPGLYYDGMSQIGLGFDVLFSTSLTPVANWILASDIAMKVVTLGPINVEVFAGLGIAMQQDTSNLFDTSSIKAGAWFAQLGPAVNLVLGPLFVQARGTWRFYSGDLAFLSPGLSKTPFDDYELALIAGLHL